MKLECTIRSQKVVKIQGERWITDSFTVGVSSWEPDVAPTDVWSDLIKKKVELACLIECCCIDAVRRKSTDGNVTEC